MCTPQALQGRPPPPTPSLVGLHRPETAFYPVTRRQVQAQATCAAQSPRHTRLSARGPALACLPPAVHKIKGLNSEQLGKYW